MTWDDLNQLERRTYTARKRRLAGDCTAQETNLYETLSNRAEMGDDLDDW